jgi:hypothetical protein
VGRVSGDLPGDVAGLTAALDGTDYLADEPLATALFLAARMPAPPILLEGEPGVGKTEAAKALAVALDTPLVRLQCYEGLTVVVSAHRLIALDDLLAALADPGPGHRPRPRVAAESVAAAHDIDHSDTWGR